MQSWQRRGAKEQGSQICSPVLENRYKAPSLFTPVWSREIDVGSGPAAASKFFVLKHFRRLEIVTNSPSRLCPSGGLSLFSTRSQSSMFMHRSALTQVRSLTLIAAGASALLAGFSQPSAAQPFPDRTFGCSVPAGYLQDDPSGLGTQRANALIVTPTGPAGVPVQGSLAIFSQVGTTSGQGRCIFYSQRRNSFNTNAHSGWVFDVGSTAYSLPAICFRPPSGFCGTMYPGTAVAGGLPAGYNSYEVFPLANGYTSATTALANLTTSIAGYTNALTILD